MSDGREKKEWEKACFDVKQAYEECAVEERKNPELGANKDPRRTSWFSQSGTSRGMESAAGLVTDEQSSPWLQHSSASLTTAHSSSLTGARRRLCQKSEN